MGIYITSQWRHNWRDGVSNHQRLNCLINRLFRLRSKKASKFRVTGLCEGNSPGTGEFPAQMASNAENVSIWWRHHDMPNICRRSWWSIYSDDRQAITRYRGCLNTHVTSLQWLPVDYGHGAFGAFVVFWKRSLLPISSSDISLTPGKSYPSTRKIPQEIWVNTRKPPQKYG